MEQIIVGLVGKIGDCGCWSGCKITGIWHRPNGSGGPGCGAENWAICCWFIKSFIKNCGTWW